MMKNLVLLFTLVSVFTISLSACNKQEGQGGEVQPQFKVAIELNDVEGEFDTHTETQNSYLNDTYDSIDKYGKGSSENSKPNSLTLSWSISDSELDLTGLKLTLFEKGLELGSDTQVPVATYLLDKDATSTTITNLKVGKDYSWSITAIAGEKQHSSRHSDFSTKDGVARFINIDGLSNVRDCGGWTGLDGKKIKQGLLYRGEEFNKQNNGRTGSSASDYHYDPSKASATDPYGQKISETGIKTVVNELQLKTEVDIRGYETFDWKSRINYSPAECGGLVGELPDGSKDPEQGVIKLIDQVDYVICPVHTNRDKLYYDSYGKTACKNFFSMLADKNRLPLYFHCAQGKDRTGFLATLFQALLGCSKEDILRDYLLSNMGKTGSVSISKITSNYNYVDYFLEGKEVSTQGGVKYQAVGETIAERAYNYLLDCGLTASQLDAIRNTFLEE